ncbi:MAG: hypothetical protein GEV09_22265 [Pseudonocardiaceae bacterium]|nr:hypothetical protein [Pseudonocardiaceae bacterium]
MEFGVMELFQRPEGTSASRVIDEAVELPVAAEGLEDSISPAEHHVSAHRNTLELARDVNHFIGWFDFGGLSRDAAHSVMERFAKDTMPASRESAGHVR